MGNKLTMGLSTLSTSSLATLCCWCRNSSYVPRMGTAQQTVLTTVTVQMTQQHYSSCPKWLHRICSQRKLKSSVRGTCTMVQRVTRSYTIYQAVHVKPFTAQWSLYIPPMATICTASGHYMYRQFNIQQFYVLPTQCIYVFCVDLRTNSHYFPIQH